MSWLKRIQPITLHQVSDLPYVICEDGVRLCYGNAYSENKDLSEHFIEFTANRHDLIRQSTHYYKFLNFPVVVPFESVIACDDAIIEGKVIKHASMVDSDTKNITVIKSHCVSRMNDEQFQNMVDIIDESDRSFLLVGEEIDPMSRLLDDMVTSIYHEKDWGRTCVSIADTVAPQPLRKYCWTKTLPELQIACYGLAGPDDMASIQDTLTFMGVQNCAVTWEEE